MRALSLDVGWSFRILVAIPLLFIGSDEFPSADQKTKSINFYSKEYNLDPFLIRAILEVEGENTGTVDRVQDFLLKSALTRHDSTWWEIWAARNDSIARRYFALRGSTGKWPVVLYSSLYVVSIGPAQITPRTILDICRKQEMKMGVKETLCDLLDEDACIELLCIVLRYETSRFRPADDIFARPELQATLYNYGSDLYEYHFGHSAVVNDFGRRVSQKMALSGK